MTLPSKGRRRVEHGGLVYHWLIRKQPTYGQGACGSSMKMAVELANAAVKGTLLVNFGVTRPRRFSHPLILDRA